MNLFDAQQVKRSHTLRIDGRVDDVFHLFDPIGEKKWSEDWNPTLIFPTSGVREGGVFVTRGSDGTEAVWVIMTFDANSRSIVYTSVKPNFKVNVIEINCRSVGVDRTRARVTYTVTALSEKGNRCVESFSNDYYREMMKHWEKAINHYLQYGCALRHH